MERSRGVMTHTQAEQRLLEAECAARQSIPPAEAAAIARHMHEVKLNLEQERNCSDIDRTLGPIVKDAMAGLVESEQITDLDRITFAAFRDSCLELGLPHLPAPPQAVAMFIAGKADCSSDELEKALRSIAKVHIAAFGISPCDDRLVKAVLNTVKSEEGQEPKTEEASDAEDQGQS